MYVQVFHYFIHNYKYTHNSNYNKYTICSPNVSVLYLHHEGDRVTLNLTLFC